MQEWELTLTPQMEFKGQKTSEKAEGMGIPQSQEPRTNQGSVTWLLTPTPCLSEPISYQASKGHWSVKDQTGVNIFPLLFPLVPQKLFLLFLLLFSGVIF